MTSPLFAGIYTAIITPFDDDGAVSLDGLSAVIEDQLGMGAEGLVVCGTTGEAATLSPKERRTVIAHALDVVNKRVPVIAGAGHNNTATACALQAEVKALGADGSLSVTPWYNKPTQEGLYRHFRTVVESAPLPTLLYNVPSRCGVDLLPPCVERLAHDVPDIVGIKEATGSIGRAQDILGRLAETRPDFAVLSGEDTFILGLLAIGGHGVISVISHLCADDLVAMKAAFLAGDLPRAQALSRQVSRLQPALFFRANPIPVKAALAKTRLEGKITAQVRPPLYRLDDDEQATLDAALEAAGYAGASR